MLRNSYGFIWDQFKLQLSNYFVFILVPLDTKEFEDSQKLRILSLFWETVRQWWEDIASLWTCMWNNHTRTSLPGQRNEHWATDISLALILHLRFSEQEWKREEEQEAAGQVRLVSYSAPGLPQPPSSLLTSSPEESLPGSQLSARRQNCTVQWPQGGGCFFSSCHSLYPTLQHTPSQGSFYSLSELVTFIWLVCCCCCSLLFLEPKPPPVSVHSCEVNFEEIV